MSNTEKELKALKVLKELQAIPWLKYPGMERLAALIPNGMQIDAREAILELESLTRPASPLAEENKRLTAQQRATQMFGMPQREVPHGAMQYVKFLAGKYGICGEVYMTAFAHYAQAVEGLACDDDLYALDSEGKQFFAPCKQALADTVAQQCAECGGSGKKMTGRVYADQANHGAIGPEFAACPKCKPKEEAADGKA